MGRIVRYAWSLIAVVAATIMVVAAAGQVVTLVTFSGWLPASYALGASSDYVLLGGLCFVVFWLIKAREEGFGRQRTQRVIHLGEAMRDRPMRTLLGIYWALTFVGLFILGGPGDKGIESVGGRYYALHADGTRGAISHMEYQHQAAYPLWMVTAWTLFFAALVLGTALPRTVWAARRNAITHLI